MTMCSLGPDIAAGISSLTDPVKFLLDPVFIIQPETPYSSLITATGEHPIFFFSYISHELYITLCCKIYKYVYMYIYIVCHVLSGAGDGASWLNTGD